MTPQIRTRRRTGPGPLAATLLGGVALTFALAGCSGGVGGSADRSAAEPAGVVRDAPEAGDAAGRTDGLLVANAAGTTAGSPQVGTRSVISNGTVTLRSGDVAEARFDVVQVVDRFGGEVTDEQTDTDDDGEVVTSHLVLRIPSANFAAAMDALEKVADLRFSASNTKDVTTEVIDTEVRLRAQRRSIARIETLLDRAKDLRDIVLIESELTRRQADLDSLEQQSAYLEDQTSLATITVDIDHERRATRDHDSTGFLAGLAAGWSGLVTVAVGLATATGAVLPWLVVLLALAIPAWPLARRLRRHRDAPAETPAEA